MKSKRVVAVLLAGLLTITNAGAGGIKVYAGEPELIVASEGDSAAEDVSFPEETQVLSEVSGQTVAIENNEGIMGDEGVDNTDATSNDGNSGTEDVSAQNPAEKSGAPESVTITFNAAGGFFENEEGTLTKADLEVATGPAKAPTILGASDYSIVSITNNTGVGTATLMIRGIGEYGGTKTISLKITAKSLK